MTKKIIARMLVIVFILYCVSLGIVLKTSNDAKFYEFLFDSPLLPYHDISYYEEGVENGEMSSQDALNAITEYYTKMLDMPSAAMCAVFDTEGNLVSESGCLLKIDVYDNVSRNVRRHCIDLEEYLTDDIKAQLEAFYTYRVDSIELFKSEDTFIPVALNVVSYSKDYESAEHRIVLSSQQTDVQYFKDVYEYGTEDVSFEIFIHRLNDDREKYFEALEALAYSEIQSAEAGVSRAGNRSEVPYFFTETQYTLSDVNLGGNRYFLFTGVSVNTFEAVFTDENYRTPVIVLTAVYLFFAGILCYTGVHLYNKKEEDKKYSDKYTGIV